MAIRHDLFVSYSSQDRAEVEILVERLRAHGLTVWFDRWEMKPGDRLRDRINQGIAGSRYFVVMLTRNSIKAPWVRVELDSAMLREIEAQKVTVIPLLLGEVDPKDIPPDLKGKHYLDFRVSAHRESELNRLVSLFDLDRRRRLYERRRLLKSLREGLPESKAPTEELLEAWQSGQNDYALQKAALAGLCRIGTPQAMLGIAKQMLDLGGIEPLEYCVVLCRDAADRGGILLLSATLFYDNRFIRQKLHAITEALRRRAATEASRQLEELGDVAAIYRDPSLVEQWSRMLSESPEPDVANGVIFGSLYDIGFGWQRTYIARFQEAVVQSAIRYVEHQLPGIGATFARFGRSRSE